MGKTVQMVQLVPRVQLALQERPGRLAPLVSWGHQDHKATMVTMAPWEHLALRGQQARQVPQARKGRRVKVHLA